MSNQILLDMHRRHAIASMLISTNLNAKHNLFILILIYLHIHKKQYTKCISTCTLTLCKTTNSKNNNQLMLLILINEKRFIYSNHLIQNTIIFHYNYIKYFSLKLVITCAYITQNRHYYSLTKKQFISNLNILKHG